MSRPPVPLPSIRDIFPEMSVSAKSPALYPHPQPSSARSRDDKHPHFHLHQPPPSPPPSSSSSESATRPQPPQKTPSYSFNVLRADPVTASLEHVASSTTLRPRASSSATHPGMHGSAPVFRVAIAPGDQRHPRHSRPHRAVREILPDTRERHHHARDPLTPSISREADPPHLHSPSSTILSFPVSEHPVSPPSALVTTDGRRVHLRSEIPGAALQGEGRGKKHQCPHCGKRFNRPSSMKIHVNTHTGAKPYRCPYPGCGREFNVNSNMRRHWRNHSRSTSVRLPDPDIGRSGVYHHPLHHGVSHTLLMSPPATNSSISEGNSDDDGYSDDEDPMDVDRAEDDIPPPSLPIKPSSGSSSSSSDVSVWSRSASPARTSTYHGTQGHRPPHHDQQARKSECIYRPSIAAYAISCTDSRVSTALRPAFTSTTCTRERDRERDRYQPRREYTS